MSTALTVYLANAASSVVGTANQLYHNGAGSPTTNQPTTTMGTSVNYGEILSQGGTAWAASGSIGSQTGKGFFLDDTTLDGQDLLAGSWSATVRLVAMQSGSQAGSMTADIVVRVSKYSGGSYTTLITMTLTGQTINATLANYSLSGSTGSATSFASGDKLYIDCWLKITAGSGNAAQGVRINRLSTDTTTKIGDATASVATPGYQATAAGVTLYGSNVADGTLTTASDMSTTTGGTETSATTTATGVAVWVEVLSRSASIATVSAIGSPSGKGWVYTPGAGSFATGNWSASVTLQASAPGTTDITIRFYKYSGGVYTSIGTINKTGVVGSKTTYSFAATSMGSVTFASGDLLYVDLWWHDLSGADDAPVCYVSSSATQGVANDMQVNAPAFTPSGGSTSRTSIVMGSGMLPGYIPAYGGSL